MFWKFFRISLLALLYVTSSALAGDVAQTKHNLSISGGSIGNLIYSSTEDEICVFCHTPHNANPAVPLWNHELGTGPYSVYESRSLDYDPANYPTPTGSSKLCLSCHDGTIAVGAVLGGEIGLTGTDPDGTITDRTNLDSYNQTDGSVDLSDDHPISIPVVQTSEVWAPEQIDPLTTSPVRLENSLVQCSSCHDAHIATENFLVLSADYGQLCQECHHQSGWNLSAHGAATTISWTDLNTSITKTVAQWACLGCHDIHRANEPELLQDDGDPVSTKLEEVCYRCHNGTAAPDIRGEFSKTYRHPVVLYETEHYPTEPIPFTSTQAHVECVDCHDPHYGQSGARVLGDDSAGGMLAGIHAPQISPGSYDYSNPTPVNPWEPPNYGPVHEIEYEYELCLKCHGTISAMDMSRDHMEDIDVYFNPANQASHGCIVRNSHSNPYVTANFRPDLNWTDTTTIACCDCHGNEDNSPERISGPHGSEFDWLLRKCDPAYADGAGNQLICYECHDSSVYGYGGANGSRSAFDDHTLSSHWNAPGVQYPEDMPPYNCFVCHGDFSYKGDRTADGTYFYGNYTPGGLHGANSGRKDRPTETTGFHFLNGLAIVIDNPSEELLTNPGTVSCGSYYDSATSSGCSQHTSKHKTYTR